MEFRVLGPLQIDGAGSPSPAGAKERLVLGCLLLDPGRPVSTDALLEAAWPGVEPAAAARSLAVRLANLRRFLAPTALARAGAGYRLEVTAEQVDARRFEALMDGAAALPAAVRLRALDEALALWRGTPFAELAGVDLAQAEIRRLDELRRRAQADRARALVELGRPAEAVGELERLAAEDPLNEDLARSLMVALYRAGRQVEALAAYRTLAAALGELGLAARRRDARARAPRPRPRDGRTSRVTSRRRPPRRPADRTRRSRVPARASRFHGREGHLARAAALLEERPLVTLNGVGGAGKTRLAAELAGRLDDRFPDGVWWCELAPAALPADVAGAVADAVGVDATSGAAGSTGRSSTSAARRGLLVLDNCEHVLDAAADVAERLVAGCPGVRVLATSRTPLGVEGEEVLAVGGLELPAGDAAPDGEASAAVALFLDRARAAGGVVDAASQLRAVAEICRRLDGLPLGIELAAGRTRSLTPVEIAARLDERFGLLAVSGRRAAARHRTLRAAVDWSYELLDEPQRRLFERLAVFARGATLEAARDVCAGEGVATGDVPELLDQLVAHSLVTATPAAAGTVYGMLETLREYATERLDARGERATLRDRHADHYVARARPVIEAALAWRSTLPFVDEFDEVRAALRWCVEADAEPQRAFTILVPLWGLSPARHAEEIAMLADEALDRWPGDHPLRLHALGTAATARLFAGDPTGARSRAEAAVALEERIGEPALLSRRTLAHLALYSAQPAEGAQLAQDAADRARAAGHEALAVECEGFGVQLLHAAGQRDAAVALAERMRGDAERLDAPFMVCWSRYVSGVVQLDGDTAEARLWLTRAIALGREIGHHHMVRFSLRALGVAALLEGDGDEAAERLLAALAHDEARTDAASQWTTLMVLALLLAERGRLEPAAELLAASDGWPAAPFLRTLTGRARELIDAGLPADRREQASRRGRARHLASAKALARDELGAGAAAPENGGGGRVGAT